MRLDDARRLASDIIKLELLVGSSYPGRCKRVASRAERLGAHSMARLCRWLGNPLSLDRHGYDQVHSYARQRAMKWLHRIELDALQRWEA